MRRLVVYFFLIIFCACKGNSSQRNDFYYNSVIEGNLIRLPLIEPYYLTGSYINDSSSSSWFLDGNFHSSLSCPDCIDVWPYNIDKIGICNNIISMYQYDTVHSGFWDITLKKHDSIIEFTMWWVIDASLKEIRAFNDSNKYRKHLKTKQVPQLELLNVNIAYKNFGNRGIFPTGWPKKSIHDSIKKN